MKKRGLSIFLSLCMGLMLLPLSLPVSAAGEGKPAYISVVGADGEEINAITAAPEKLPEGLSYDAETNTLTLNNVNLTSYVQSRSWSAVVIGGGSNLTIRLIGNNIIRTDNQKSHYGIVLADGDATQETHITGDGCLVVDGPMAQAINTRGKLTIDSSVPLLAGFVGRGLFSAGGRITIGGEPYTGNTKEGAVVNGKVVDKVRKATLDLTADSVGYGSAGATFNPSTTSVTVEETGEGWGWNHRTKTLTMSGTVIYNQTPLSTGSRQSGVNFITENASAGVDTIKLTEGTANAVIMGEVVQGNSVLYVNGISGSYLNITGGGSLTSVGGVNNKYESGWGYGIDSTTLNISGSCTVTGVGGIVKAQSFGIAGGNSIDISASAKILGLGGRARSSFGMYLHSPNRIHISGDAQVEARGENSGVVANFGKVEIDGGTVKVVGGEYGLKANQAMIVTGGSITAIGGKASLYSYEGTFSVTPAQKRLGVYAGEKAPGSRVAVVTAPDTYTLTSGQVAKKYIHIAYEPLQTDGKNVNAVYIPGGAMETVYSVDVIWGSMEFTYSTGYEGVWNPDTHQLDGVVPAGWSCEEGANKVRVVNHSNTAVDVGFAYTKAAGFDGVAGAFDNAGEKLPSAMGTAVDAAPETLAVLTMSGELSASTNEKIQIGTVTVSIDAAGGE